MLSPSPAQFRWVRATTDIPFGSADGSPLLLDVALPDPAPSEPMPAIVHIHGGAWLQGEKAIGTNILFAQNGFFTVSISYRLSGQAIFPACLHDCKAAVRWLRANAALWHIDPDRIGVRGDSAGGHLAALLGTSGDVAALEGDSGSPGYSSRAQAVVDEFGATDMLQPEDSKEPNPVTLREAAERLFGGPLSERTELVQAGNPITYIQPDVPPFLIVHGDSDPNIPIKQSERLYKALLEAGCDVTFVRVPGGGHGFSGRQQEEVMQRELAFFQKHLT